MKRKHHKENILKFETPEFGVMLKKKKMNKQVINKKKLNSKYLFW